MDQRRLVQIIVTLTKVMKRLFSLLAFFAAAACAGTLYLPAYPAAVLVFDESKGQVVDRIPLETGTPMSIRLTPDHKKIYVTTIDHNGIEVIDVGTRKVTNHFVLNTATKQYRFRGGAVDPSGKFFYTVTREIDKLPEHFEVQHAKYTVIDLEQHKIVKTADMSLEDERTNRLSYRSFARRKVSLPIRAEDQDSCRPRTSRWWMNWTWRSRISARWRTSTWEATWI